MDYRTSPSHRHAGKASDGGRAGLHSLSVPHVLPQVLTEDLARGT